MKVKALMAALILLMAFPAYGGETLKELDKLTPESLRESCYRYGAVRTVRRLTAEGSPHWAELLGHIAEGDSRWIVYVPLFASGTDAGYATQLTIALAEALPKNPHSVLSLEYAFLSLRGVCSLPFVNPDEEFIRDYRQSVEVAMHNITDPYMQMDKQICLSRLDKAAEMALKRLDAAKAGK